MNNCPYISKTNIITSLFTTALLTTPLSFAQEYKLSVGAGAFYSKLPYQGWNGDEVTPIPYLSYKNSNFYVDGTDVGYSLLSKDTPSEGYSLDLVTSVAVGDGYESKDSPFLTGMDDRDDIALETGVKFYYYQAYGLIEMAIKQDIAGANKGLTANFTYSLPIEGKNYQFIPYIGAIYQNNKYNNYYYGVKNNESTAIRSQYDADGGVNTYIGTTFIYSFNQHWGLTLDMQYQQLSNEIKDSPIVSKSSIVSGFIGVSYTF